MQETSTDMDESVSRRTLLPGQDGILKKRERQPVSEPLSAFLLRISDEIEELDKYKRLSLFRNQIKATRYYDGNFYGYVDENCEWREATIEEGEVRYSDNQLYQYVRTALMELSRTQTQVLINASNDTEEWRNVARLAQDRYNKTREQTFNALLKQTENLYALLNGICFRYSYFKFDSGGKGEKVPRINNNKENGGGQETRICANCARPVSENQKTDYLSGMDGMDASGEMSKQTSMDEMEQCPNCGSPIFDDINAFAGETSSIDYESAPSGRNVWVSPNPIGIIVSMQAACIEETPFLKWKQLILRSILEEKYKDVELPTTGVSTELRYIGNQQVSTPSGSGNSVNSGYSSSSLDTTVNRNNAGRELELLEFGQHWLDYPVYCNKTFTDDCRLPNGDTLPAGQKLGSKYQKGLYFARCGTLILDMWNEDKNRKWSSSPYSLRAGSMYGAGISSALSDQETVNDLERLKMANAWANGVPRELVDEEIITEISVDPNIPTRINNPDGRRLDTFYQLIAPPPLSQEVYALTMERKQAMQGKIGAFSLQGSGASDLQAIGKTATAIGIARDLAVGRFAPDLELMADNLDRCQATQFLKNEQEFFTPAKWQSVQGEYSAEAVRLFQSCDIENDLIINIAPGSFMPRSEAQDLAKLEGLLTLLPNLLQVQNPELTAYAFEKFGLPEELGGWNAERQQADMVIEKFTDLANEFVQQSGDAPDTDLMNPAIKKAADLISSYSKMPVDVFLDNHEAAIEAFRDWRETDKGRSASNVLTAAVANRLAMHQQAITKQRQILAQMEVDAQAPLKAAADEEQAKQLQIQGAMEEKQKGAQEEDAEKAMAGEALTKLADAQESDTKREHEAEQSALDRQHELDMAKAKGVPTASSAQ